MKVEHFKFLTRIALGIAFAAVGVSHFTNPELFLSIMPPYLPWHLELVYLSGVCEIVGGLWLFFPQTRRWAVWGLVALLIAVYPANIHMLVNEVYLEDMRQEKWILWVRMPIQFLLAFALIWSGSVWHRDTEIS